MPTTPTAAPAEIAQALLRAARDGPALASCTVLSAPDSEPASPADRMLVPAQGPPIGNIGGGPFQDAVIQHARSAIPKHLVASLAFTPAGQLVEGRRAIEAASQIIEILVEVVEPPARLLVVGGGHVGRSIVEFGALLGMSTAVLDDREDYASPDRFPFADQVICGDFAEELQRFPINANTFIVLVSRGHTVDELSLRQVADRGAAYVGMIGSKRRTRTVLEHLQHEGIDQNALAQVFTPIGLDIGAETPEEIALSVLAEIVLVRRGGNALPMSPRGRQLADR